MFRSTPARLLLSVTVLGAMLAVAPGSAQEPKRGFADPMLGRWNLEVQGPDGPYPSWLEVRLRKETELMGRFVGQFGSVRYATEVTYDNGRLVVVVPVQYEQNKSDLRFEGTLTGDRLEGTTQAADGSPLKWSGVRAPALRRDTPSTWGEPIALFNGRDLSGWKPRSSERAGCWSVTDGLLVATPPCVDLVTERTFEDFKLHVEFMYPEGSNSGLYLRGRYEVQIQDDAGMALDPLRMGGVYGFLMPSTDAARQAGQWQTFDVTLVGRRVTLALNEQVIVDREEIPGITGGALDSQEGTPGPLMLQGDHGKISFRQVTLTPASSGSR
ncbi:MAG TPA: DUF1080 domain-containing protein [Methylomirabilota bacterium]